MPTLTLRALEWHWESNFPSCKVPSLALVQAQYNQGRPL